MDLEDEARHLGLRRFHRTGLRRCRTRRRCDTDEAFEQFADAEIVDRRTEEDRCDLTAQIGFAVERVVDALDQFDIGPQLVGEFRADAVVQFRRGEVGDFYRRGVGRQTFVRRKERQILFVKVVDPFEIGAVSDGKGQRTHTDVQLLLHLIQEVERFFRRTVELIDEDDDRRIAHPADLHQFAGLRLDAFCAIDDDDDRIDRRKCAISILGEIFVARCVENIDFHPFVFESHDRRRNRDAALAFDFHEVRCRALLDFVVLDGTGDVDGSAEKQQLFGQCGFTGIRMGDDSKRPPTDYFFLLCHNRCSDWFFGPAKIRKTFGKSGRFRYICMETSYDKDP